MTRKSLIEFASGFLSGTAASAIYQVVAYGLVSFGKSIICGLFATVASMLSITLLRSYQNRTWKRQRPTLPRRP